MPHHVYNTIHLISLFALLLSLGANALFAHFSSKEEDKGTYVSIMIFHGVAMFGVLLGGFGMLAKRPVSGDGSWPTWLIVKLVIWVLLGAMVAFNRRVKAPWLVKGALSVVLSAVAVYMVIYRPF